MVQPFLIISRVHQSYIGKFLQISPNLVKHPISICHLILLSVIASGDHLLAQNMIKHLLPVYQNHCFDPFYYSPLPQILTTGKPDHLLPPVTSPWPELNNWGVKTPFYSAGQPSFHLPSTSLLFHWITKASKITSHLFTPHLTPPDKVATSSKP